MCLILHILVSVWQPAMADNKASEIKPTESPVTLSKSDEFTQKMNEVVKSGFITLGLALGSRLGLFKAMAQLDGPATSKQIADAVNCKERSICIGVLM